MWGIRQEAAWVVHRGHDPSDERRPHRRVRRQRRRTEQRQRAQRAQQQAGTDGARDGALEPQRAPLISLAFMLWLNWLHPTSSRSAQVEKDAPSEPTGASTNLGGFCYDSEGGKEGAGTL